VQTAPHELSSAVQRLGDFLLASAPAGGFASVPRRSIPKMSHFTEVKTKFVDKILLAKSIRDMGQKVLVAEGDDVLPVRGAERDLEKAQLVIQQGNGVDIGFKYNGKEFELVTYQEFWMLPQSVNSFLSQLSQKYAINTILDRAKEDNFDVSNIDQDASGKVTLKLRRFANTVY